MKILLVYPPISLWERYSSDIGHSGGRQIPLGIYYLASYVRQAGHDVCVIDGEAHGMTVSAVVSKVLEYRPDIVGISSTTVAFHRALETAREIKAHTPDIPVVVGGPHVTAVREDVLSHPEIDFAVFGEGEETLKDLLNTLASGGNVSLVKGLAFRNGVMPTINAPRPFIEDLDSIPFPAYDLISDFRLYNPPPTNYKSLPVANVVTSRGCPNRCTFCGHSVFGRTFRQRSPENIAAEIELLYHHYLVREIAFVDDTFTILPERIFDLFRILNHKSIRFPWTCMSRINTVVFETIKFMKDQGCWHISFGIESGNADILRLIRKDISLAETKKVVGWCRQLGIRTKGFFIIGHPGETLTTIDQTIRTALDLPLDDVVVTLNTPLPGTEQYQTATDYGSMERGNWSRFNMWNPVFVPKGLTKEILLGKHREFYRRFYLRPRIIRRYALSFLSRAGLRRALSVIQSIPFMFGRHKSGGRGNHAH
ncbi:MAG: radical SAM protein [Syntrophales bacterium]|nr:radical SAM protein [Syntrophales bacterium]